MRTEYRFFSDHSGFLFNVFNSDPDWQKPDNFLLIEVLYFLARNRKQKGEIGLEGYFTCRRVTEELQRLGYVPEDVLAGINMLLRGQLIGADHMNFDAVQLDDSVRVLASGYMHVRILVARMEYLYGIVPTTPILDLTVAEQLAEYVKQENQRGKISQFQTARAVDIFYRYLLQQSKGNATPFSTVRETGAAYVLSHVSGALEHSRNIRQGTPKELDSLDL